MSKKYRFEAASDSGAAFLFSNYDPIMKVAVLEFRTHKQMDEYQTMNPTIQIRRQLPILLEVVEVDTTDQKKITNNLKRLADWHFYTHIRK